MYERGRNAIDFWFLVASCSVGSSPSLWCAHFKCEVQNRLGKLQHRSGHMNSPWNELIEHISTVGGNIPFRCAKVSQSPSENWHIPWKMMVGNKDVSFIFRVVLGLENCSERHDTQEFHVNSKTYTMIHHACCTSGERHRFWKNPGNTCHYYHPTEQESLRHSIAA